MKESMLNLKENNNTALANIFYD